MGMVVVVIILGIFANYKYKVKKGILTFQYYCIYFKMYILYHNIYISVM